MKKKLLFVLICSVFVTGIVSATAVADPVEKIDRKERCPVCGMFVAKYQPWITQIINKDGAVSMFDGAKDMLAFYFEPARYGGSGSTIDSEIWVKDYYSMEWINGRKSYYVIGSDVYGPMGHEFIPFDSQAAADNFLKDHKGKKILRFEEITLELVNSKRQGQTMKSHK